jgi:hypothetical protein
MGTLNLTNPTSHHTRVMRERASQPVVIAIHKRGQWTAVCLYGSSEHRSPTPFPTREAALGEARRMAATLMHADVGGAL